MEEEELIEKFYILKKKRDKLAIESRELDKSYSIHEFNLKQDLMSENSKELDSLRAKKKRLDLELSRLWKEATLTYLVCEVRDTFWHDYVKYERQRKYWGEIELVTNIKPGVIEAIDKYCVLELTSSSAIKDLVTELIDDKLKELGYNTRETEMHTVESKIADIEMNIDRRLSGGKLSKLKNKYDSVMKQLNSIDVKIENIKFKLEEDESLKHNKWRIKRILAGK